MHDVPVTGTAVAPVRTGPAPSRACRPADPADVAPGHAAASVVTPVAAGVTPPSVGSVTGDGPVVVPIPDRSSGLRVTRLRLARERRQRSPSAGAVARGVRGPVGVTADDEGRQAVRDRRDRDGG